MLAIASPPVLPSQVDGISIVAASDLPRAAHRQELGDFCLNYVAKPKSAAAKSAVARGWFVTSEVALDGYELVGIFSQAEDGTSSTCMIRDGNVVVYKDRQVLAIAYGKTAQALSAGPIGSVIETSVPHTARIQPGSVGSPSADLNIGAEGIAIVNVAAEDPACDGRLRVPNIFDLSIPEARKKLAKAGWKPQKLNPEEFDEVPEDLSRFEEVHTCAGTGFGFCELSYRHSGGATLSVTTADDPPIVLWVDVQCPGTRRPVD